MPFGLLIIGLLLIVTGANDTYKDAGKLLVGDFTGQGNFIYWMLAFGALGAIGYSPTLRPFSRGFMVLIFIALIVKNGGFFDKFGAAIGQGTGGGSGNSTTAVSEAASLATTAVNLAEEGAQLAAVFA